MKKAKPLKLDLGCGKAPQPGFVGVDIKAWAKGVQVTDLTKPWPWADGSVEEVHCRNLLQALTPEQRVHFVNELYRVLRGPGGGETGGRAQIIVPHWCANIAYADPTNVCWPPVVEGWFLLTNKKIREEGAYWVSGYECDFDFTTGYGMHPEVTVRAQEYQIDRLKWSKEAAQELIVTLVKRG